MPRNIEIKAAIANVDSLLSRASAVAGCVPQCIEQDDSFFRVPQGRLKLRRFADGSAELIHYQRSDIRAAKASDYVRVPVAEPERLQVALARACGLLGRVQKTRWLWQVEAGGFSTRIHLDRVWGLGDFMELEVVLKDGQSDAAGAQVAEALMVSLGLASAPRLAGAYLDMGVDTAATPQRCSG